MTHLHQAEIIDITGRLATAKRQLRRADPLPPGEHPILEISDGDRYLGWVGGPGRTTYYAWGPQSALIGRFKTEADAIAAVRAQA